MTRFMAPRWFQRMTAGTVLLAYVVGCTHMPTGEKAFDSFDSCIASNLGLAAIGGIGFGALGTQLAKQFTDYKPTAKAVGTATGIAAASMIAMTAWRKCAIVYNKSEPVQDRAEPQPKLSPAEGVRKHGLTLDRLEIRVDGTENDPPVPEFDFSFLAEDPGVKDIAAKLRHKVEIVRFKADDNDQLVLADGRGETLLDGAGKPIALGAAIKMPRERLHWISIAEEGKQDYVEDVIIQQSQRTTYRHKLQIPSRAQLPLPLPVPMRYTLSIEAGNMKSARTVDFALLTTGARPKRYSAPAAEIALDKNISVASSVVTSASGSVQNALTATYATKRRIHLFSDAGPAGTPVISLKPGAKVLLEARTQVRTHNHAVEWLKLVPESSPGGWAPASELVEIK